MITLRICIQRLDKFSRNNNIHYSVNNRFRLWPPFLKHSTYLVRVRVFFASSEQSGLVILPLTIATIKRNFAAATTNINTTNKVTNVVTDFPGIMTENSNDDNNKIKTVTEGSCHMCFAKNEETAVFYNPVQVQNRDLSVLMISLYAERRRIKQKQILEAKMKKKKQVGNDKASDPNNGNRNENENGPPPDSDKHDCDNEGLCILDALAASGLRSMRYWKECPDIQHITINDLDPAAYDRAVQNIQSNGLADVAILQQQQQQQQQQGRPNGIRIKTADATHVMYNSRQPSRKRPHYPKIKNVSLQEQDTLQYDIIDLDPYGSASPFLDSAIQSVCTGGMINVTCTDMAALGGSHPETCFGRYASMPISRAGYLQELAVRILLYDLATTAARYGRTIHPILSVGMDFYIRVFVEVFDNKAGVNDLSLQVGNVYQSTQCPSFYIVPSGQKGGKKGNVYQPGRLTEGVCTETGASLKIAGPIWLGPMHDRDVLKVALQRLEGKSNKCNELADYPDLKYIATKDRLRGLLTSCMEELLDVPLYYKVSDLSKCLHLSTPPMIKVKSALVNAGYRVSGYHKEPAALKTDAPSAVVWDVLRAWAKQQPPKNAPKENSTAAIILAKEPTIEMDFSIPQTVRETNTMINTVSRFPVNPQKNWGPKAKATGIKRNVEKESTDGNGKRRKEDQQKGD